MKDYWDGQRKGKSNGVVANDPPAVAAAVIDEDIDMAL